MDWTHTLQIDQLALFAKSHVREISYALATSFVVVVSRPIDSFMAKLVGQWNFFLRTLAWIGIFTFGYSLLSSWTEIILRGFLSDQKAVPMLVLTTLAFVGFGVWAGQTRNHR